MRTEQPATSETEGEAGAVNRFKAPLTVMFYITDNPKAELLIWLSPVLFSRSVCLDDLFVRLRYLSFSC